MSNSPDSDDERDEKTRRWLIRLLVAIGLGIPILIEGATFVELIRDQLFGDGDGEERTATTTVGESAVGVGDELLPETAAAETVREAFVQADDGWTFTLVVEVENTTDVPYELVLEGVTVEDGTRVSGGAATGRVQPGETASVTGRWDVPEGQTPTSIDVAGISYASDGTREETAASVRLAKVPVMGG